MIKDQICPIKRISPDDGAQYFYGYYDNPAFDSKGRRHLCNKAGFRDRLPEKEDVCALGVIDLEPKPVRGDSGSSVSKSGSTGMAGSDSPSSGNGISSGFSQFAETTLWNFQQGAMLQFLGGQDNVVAYNTRDSKGNYKCVVHDLSSGSIRMLSRAAANISRDGRYALSINFDRLYDFRPGYGYSGNRDKFYDIKQPEDDGIFVMDMKTGDSHLILSYREIVGIFGKASPEIKSEKLLINHITFNPSADRFVFLVRNFPSPGSRWATGVGTAARDGSDVRIMMEFALASHYYWRDDERLLIWGKCAKSDDKAGMLLFNDSNGDMAVISPEFFVKDIHCIYSPDLKYIVGDGYPDKERCRPVYLYNTETGKNTVLFRVWSMSDSITDTRCDLHNRWSPDGRSISFDSTHEGFRGVYVADLSNILKQLD